MASPLAALRQVSGEPRWLGDALRRQRRMLRTATIAPGISAVRTRFGGALLGEKLIATLSDRLAATLHWWMVPASPPPASMGSRRSAPDLAAVMMPPTGATAVDATDATVTHPRGRWMERTSTGGQESPADAQATLARIAAELVDDRYDSPMPSLWWHAAILPRRLRAHACDVVFLPAGNRRLGFAYGVPSVATVHDLSQLHVPQKYDTARMFYATRVLPMLIGRQDHVVAVSGSPRADVLERTRIAADRVSVVPNGVDLSRYAVRDSGAAQRAASRLGLDHPYFLYVARLEHPGKNHVTLLEAYARLRPAGVTHKLVLAGPRWSGAEAIDAAALPVSLGPERHPPFAQSGHPQANRRGAQDYLERDDQGG